MRQKTCLFVLGLMLAVPVITGATTVRPFDFRTLAQNADVIAHARVIALESQWANGPDGIDTVVTIAVTRYLKGNLGAQVVFRVPGGQIGRWRMIRVGAPVFHQGEEIVVFLASSSSAAFPHVVGFNQGVLRVSADPVSGARTVTAPMLAGDAVTPTPLVRGDPSRGPISLEQFAARVQSVLDGGRSARPAGDKPVIGKAVKRVR